MRIVRKDLKIGFVEVTDEVVTVLLEAIPPRGTTYEWMIRTTVNAYALAQSKDQDVLARIARVSAKAWSEYATPDQASERFQRPPDPPDEEDDEE